MSIPGIKNEKQANEILYCASQRLTNQEVTILEEAAQNTGRQTCNHRRAQQSKGELCEFLFKI